MTTKPLQNKHLKERIVQVKQHTQQATPNKHTQSKVNAMSRNMVGKQYENVNNERHTRQWNIYKYRETMGLPPRNDQW